MLNYEDIEITGNKRKGYTVSWYEWRTGYGRDCGLNREASFGTRDEANEYAAELREQSGR